MANQRLPMYQLRRILHLRQQGYSKRAIAATLALARSTVDQYLATIEGHFTSLDEALSWQDDQLHRLLAQPLRPKKIVLAIFMSVLPALMPSSVSRV